MKKFLFVSLCCLCLCGCGNKEEKWKQTECVNQSKGQISMWTLYHDGSKIYKVKHESSQKYNTKYELEEAEKEAKEFYNSRKEKYEEQGGKVSIDIMQSGDSLLEKFVFDCSENNFFPNIGCDYQNELKAFDNDIISYTCIEKD